MAAAAIVKALLAWTNPGFFSGDDVEIHEMSLGVLWRADWPIWDLRNALFPLGVVYPFQKLFVVIGRITDAGTLIFAGRLAVAIISSAGVWLLWQAGRRIWPAAPGWAAAAALLFATTKLHIAFGSTELPRPVAAVFVVGAFVLLQDARGARTVFAAVLLGLAAACRFSEAIFVVPAVLALAWQRRWAAAATVAAVAAGTALALVGLSDAWYWGEPFHSLNAVVDYTLVRQLSSRGYQHVAWYVVHVFEWINPAIVLLGLVGAVAAPRIGDLWIWAPLVLLSLLPHKEARYAIPIVPFVCLLAIRGLQIVVPAALGGKAQTRQWRPLALTALLLIGLAYDAGHWRLPRTNADVRFARRLNEILPADSVVSAEQAWRLGGHIYLRPREVIDLDPNRLSDPAYLAQQTPAGTAIILDARTMSRSGVTAALRERGYEEVPLTVEGTRYRLWHTVVRTGISTR
jgi:hypothetical protein